MHDSGIAKDKIIGHFSIYENGVRVWRHEVYIDVFEDDSVRLVAECRPKFPLEPKRGL